MASKITQLKVKKDNGSFDTYPFGVNSEYVTLENNENLQEWIDSLKLKVEWDPITDV